MCRMATFVDTNHRYFCSGQAIEHFDDIYVPDRTRVVKSMSQGFKTDIAILGKFSRNEDLRIASKYPRNMESRQDDDDRVYHRKEC